MKSTLLFTTLWLGSLSAFLTPVQLVAQAENPKHTRYAVFDLGTFGGAGTNSSAYDMNQAGWVAGSANLTAGGPQHAFLWYGRGPLLDVGTLGRTKQRSGRSQPSRRRSDSFRDCRDGSEWRRLLRFRYPSAMPRGDLAEWATDSPSHPAGRQQRPGIRSQ